MVDKSRKFGLRQSVNLDEQKGKSERERERARESERECQREFKVKLSFRLRVNLKKIYYHATQISPVLN